MVVRLPSNGRITPTPLAGSPSPDELLNPRRGLPNLSEPTKFLAPEGRLTRNQEQPARFDLQPLAFEPVPVRPG